MFSFIPHRRSVFIHTTQTECFHSYRTDKVFSFIPHRRFFSSYHTDEGFSFIPHRRSVFLQIKVNKTCISWPEPPSELPRRYSLPGGSKALVRDFNGDYDGRSYSRDWRKLPKICRSLLSSFKYSIRLDEHLSSAQLGWSWTKLNTVLIFHNSLLFYVSLKSFCSSKPVFQNFPNFYF